MSKCRRARNEKKHLVKRTVRILIALFMLKRINKLAKKFGKLTNQIISEKSKTEKIN